MTIFPTRVNFPLPDDLTASDDAGLTHWSFTRGSLTLYQFFSKRELNQEKQNTITELKLEINQE